MTPKGRIGLWLFRLAFALLVLFFSSYPAAAQEDAYHPKSIPWIVSRNVCDAKMPRHVETAGTVDYVHKEKAVTEIKEIGR